MTEQQAAAMYQVSHRTLQKWRRTGTGPRFTKVGPLVRYSVADLEEWAAKNARNSTSDPGLAA